MRSSHLLVILALVALGVVVLTVSTDSGSMRAIDAIAPLDSASRAGREEPEPLPEDSRAGAPSAESRVSPVVGERREARQRASSGAHAEGAREVRGVLVLPPMALWDPTARVLSVAAPDRARPTNSFFDRFSGSDAGPARETEVLDGVPVEADGTFRLACAPDAEWVYLEIDALYLYLAEPQAVRLTGAVTQVDLAPMWGASLKGRWIAPPDAIGAELELAGGNAYLTTQSGNQFSAFFGVEGSGSPVFHSVRSGADGSFEMRGIEPGPAWVVVSHPPLLASQITDELVFLPGETLEVLIPLARGARVAGRVVDRAGAPVPGAWVEVAVGGDDEDEDSGSARLFTRSAITRSDGGFSISGLVPGVLLVRAEKEGYRKGIRKKLELAPGASVSVEIKLRQGEALRGTVSWSDGSVAPNAVVQVGRDASARTEPLDTAARTLYGEYAADEHGRFEITGLKRRAQSIWAFASRAGKEGLVEGAAQEDGVEPSEDDSHALVLAERPLLSGIVRDGAGAPVTAFRVIVRPDEGAGSMMTSLSAAKSMLERDVVSPDGTFALERLWEGEFAVTIEAEGFATSRPRGFSLPIATGTPALEIVLAPFAGLSGRVVSPAGEPVAGAKVSAARPARSGLDVMLVEAVPPASVLANARGEFAFTQLDPGEFVLSATGPQWVVSEGLPLELQPGEAQIGLVIALRMGARLTGEVLDALGEPIAERSVSAKPKEVSTRARFMSFESGEEEATTDANGWFEFEGLVPGEAVVSLRPTAEEMEGVGGEDWWRVMQGTLRETVELVDGATTHVVLGGVGPERGEPVLVSGRVTLRGRPLSGKISFSVDAEGPGLPGPAVELGSAGEYELEVAHPGEHRIHFVSGPEPTLSSLAFDSDDESEGVGPATLTHTYYRRIPAVKRFELDFALPGGRIAGRVFAPDGEPAENVQMTIRRVGPTPSRGRDFGRFFGGNATDAGGAYEFTDLEPGAYVVGAGSPMIALFVGGALGYGRETTTVELGQDEDQGGVDIALGAPCEIEGRVVDASGEPVNGASIFLYDASGVPVDAFSTTTSNASGRFRSEGLAEGTYTLFARTPELVSSLSEAVVVRAGRAGSTTLRMEPGATLVVTVFDAGGGKARAGVSAIDELGREFNGLVGFSSMMSWMSDGGAERTSRIGPLAPGYYRVLARTDSGQEDARAIVVRRGDAEIAVDLALDE